MNEQNDVSEPAPVPAAKHARGRAHHELVPKFHFKRLGRELAMQFLFECDIAGTDDLAENLENFWFQAEHSGEFPNSRIFRKARAYAEKIISGVCENESSIDAVISETSDKWDISRMSTVDRNIIRVAVFELFHCPDIPALVSINEAIEIAKDYSSSKSGNFINGLLNTIKDKLPPHAKNPDCKNPGSREDA
ncbi:MAG: transcription antitermination factor NusB [Lentisphaerae bacterium]|nr:transcription antitermination factor NusB [Lentisphaerota bacterium]